MPVQLRLILGLLFLSAVAGSFYGVYRWGYAQAGSDQKSECQQKSIESLQAIIAENHALIASANVASLALGASINEKSKADANSTNQIRTALATTAVERVVCVFDVDVMRTITRAADRADRAATAGITNNLPSSAKAE